MGTALTLDSCRLAVCYLLLACCSLLNFLQFTRFQVELALISQFPLDVTALSEALDRFWGRWDHDGSGYVSANEFVAPGKGQCAQAPGPHPAQALAAAGAGAPPRRAAGPPQGPTSPQQGAETPSGLKGGKGHSRVYPAGWHDQCHDRLSDCQKEYPVSSSQSHNHKLLPPYTS